MYNQGPVIVLELPTQLDEMGITDFLEELRPLLRLDCPRRIVFDCSNVEHIDSAGIKMLIQCLEEAMTCDGGFKLAVIPPTSAVLTELIRVDRLFEIFETLEAAALSFHMFGSPAIPHSQPWYSLASQMGDVKAAS
jgi:anti-anti-sigma factor